MEKTCRLVHITYRENNRGPGREEYKIRLSLNFDIDGAPVAATLGELTTY